MNLGTTFMHFLTSTWSETDISAFLIAFLQMHPKWLPINNGCNLEFFPKTLFYDLTRDSIANNFIFSDFLLVGNTLAKQKDCQNWASQQTFGFSKIEICLKHVLNNKTQKHPDPLKISSLKNQVLWTEFFVNSKLDFYCLYSL